MTSNTYFSENWNAFWNHPRLLKRSSSAITQKQFQTCLSHIQLNLKKKKKLKNNEKKRQGHLMVHSTGILPLVRSHSSSLGCTPRGQ